MGNGIKSLQEYLPIKISLDFIEEVSHCGALFTGRWHTYIWEKTIRSYIKPRFYFSGIVKLESLSKKK